ncbi:hypothetical protein RJT34_17692 [Clitoria ternatea]|uniref:Uncharacterized protein n=1 Tax=Clitoria ternatea TaxID=43366 RepID=A0AAN9JAY9_CLITE
MLDFPTKALVNTNGFVNKIRHRNWKVSSPFPQNVFTELQSLSPQYVPKFRCLRCDNCKRTIEDELNGKKDQGDSSNGIHENPILNDALNRFQVDLSKHIVVENDTDDDKGNDCTPNECTNAKPIRGYNKNVVSNMEIDKSNINNIGNCSSKLDMGEVVVATKEDNLIRCITEHVLLKLDGKDDSNLSSRNMDHNVENVSLDHHQQKRPVINKKKKQKMRLFKDILRNSVVLNNDQIIQDGSFSQISSQTLPITITGNMVTPANKKITSKGCERKRKPLQDVKLKAIHVPLEREENEKVKEDAKEVHDNLNIKGKLLQENKELGNNDNIVEDLIAQKEVENLSNMPLSVASPFPKNLQEDTSKSILRGNSDESNSLSEQSLSLTGIKNDFLIKGKGVVNEEIIGVTDKDMTSEDMEIGNTKNVIALMTEDNDSDNEIMEIAEVMTTTLPGHVNCHQKSSYEKEKTQEDEEEIEEIPRKEKSPVINEILVDYFFLYNGKRYRMNENPYLVHSSSIMLGDFPSSGVHISQVDTWGLDYNQTFGSSSKATQFVSSNDEVFHHDKVAKMTVSPTTNNTMMNMSSPQSASVHMPYKERNIDLNIPYSDIIDGEKSNIDVDYGDLSKGNTEFLFFPQHDGIELQSKQTSSFDFYSNGKIANKHKLNLDREGEQPDITSFGSGCSEKRPKGIFHLSECSNTELEIENSKIPNQFDNSFSSIPSHSILGSYSSVKLDKGSTSATNPNMTMFEKRNKSDSSSLMNRFKLFGFDLEKQIPIKNSSAHEIPENLLNSAHGSSFDMLNRNAVEFTTLGDPRNCCMMDKEDHKHERNNSKKRSHSPSQHESNQKRTYKKY